MKNARRLLAVVGILLFAAQVGRATTTTFTSRPAWQAAVAAAGLSVGYTEDFNTFASDTSFRMAPLNVNSHFTLSQTGADQVFRNLVDTPPFDFTDNNGTKHASLYTNFGTASTGTFVNMSFPSPVAAWGGDFSQDTLLESLNINLNTSNGVLSTLQVPDTANATFFFGFVTTPSDNISSLTFLSRTDSSGSAGEGFGLDNVSAANAVPEPATWMLLSVGSVCAFVLSRRRSVRPNATQ